MKGSNESMKYMFVNSKFFAYTLWMAFEKLMDPSDAGECRVMIGSFVVVSLEIISCSKSSTNNSSSSSLNDKVFFF